MPLATRHRSCANDFTCRAGMALEEVRNVEKFTRIPLAAVRCASKDMAGLEQVAYRQRRVDVTHR